MLMKTVYTIFFSFVFLLAATIGETQEGTPIQNIERYFPDEVGFTWTYKGSVADQIQRVATATYTNVATVKGTAEKKGVQVKIFTESNQANEGPAESYFFKDQNGIVYYGGEPTTPFETQIVPYRVVRFPVLFHKPFWQIQKAGISFGSDLDNDGKDEEADVSAQITAIGFETITVPAGTFKNALKLEGTLTIQVTLSRNQKVVQMIDKTTNWFGEGVGMLKGVERMEYPAVNGNSPNGSIITEELAEYTQQKKSSH